MLIVERLRLTIFYSSFSSKATDCFPMHNACKSSEGLSDYLLSGIMTFIMGIVTMIRLTRNMPRKLTETALYGNPAYCNGMAMKANQLSAPSMSSDDYMNMMKRMAELEEKVTVLSKKPTLMPPEKEEMLNNALNRVNALEQELSATKKVFIVVFLNSVIEVCIQRN